MQAKLPKLASSHQSFHLLQMEVSKSCVLGLYGQGQPDYISPSGSRAARVKLLCYSSNHGITGAELSSCLPQLLPCVCLMSYEAFLHLLAEMRVPQAASPQRHKY